MVNGPLRFVQRGPADQHSSQHAQGQQRDVPGFADRRADRVQRTITYHDPQVPGEVFRHIGDGADEPDPLASFVFPRVGDQLQRLLDPFALNARAESLAGMPLDHLTPLPPIRDWFAVGQHDPVTRPQPSPLGRAVAHHLADHRRQYRLPGHQPNPFENLRRIGQPLELAGIQGTDSSPVVGIQHFDLDRLPGHGPIHQRQHHRAQCRSRFTVDGHHQVALAKIARFGQRLRSRLVQQWFDPRYAHHEHEGIREHGEQKIKGGSRPTRWRCANPPAGD
jgi:hypothetical protein